MIRIFRSRNKIYLRYVTYESSLFSPPFYFYFRSGETQFSTMDSGRVAVTFRGIQIAALLYSLLLGYSYLLHTYYCIDINSSTYLHALVEASLKIEAISISRHSLLSLAVTGKIFPSLVPGVPEECAAIFIYSHCLLY